MIAGLVLAGGRSRRFGSEKAVVRLGDRTLLEWALNVLRESCDELAVSARADSGAAVVARGLGLPVLIDDPSHPDGPLAGVAAGLRWASGLGAAHLATLPCDTPHASLDLVTRLHAAGGDAFAAFAQTDDGPHPLCALWSIDLLASLESELARGHPAVRVFLGDVGGVAVRFGEAAGFVNVNAPGDL
ncbi:MAG: molybdenum cofactor guanylyltransferase [Caulobacterales bacterium]|nr:molybdenum cofactor guanylyltransferase [Caulobacterales bacterium]